MRKNVGIIAGGDSKEIIISLQSAKLVEKLVDTDLYNVYTIHIQGENWEAALGSSKYQMDKNDFSFQHNNQKIKIDFALIIIHGTPGEDGRLQAYFDLIKLPYSTCGFFESALTFNKHACKLYLKEYGILSPKAVVVRKKMEYDSEQIAKKVGFPCFVKPNEGGSSFGTTKAKNQDELKNAVELALQEDNEVIIEEFIEGTEVTCGIIKTSVRSYILPLTEIVSKNDFFDYDAKYKGMADEITPARISESLTKECQQISSDIYDILNCKGIVRADYILKDNKFYFLEINTVPGMSAASIIPQQADVEKIDLKRVYTEIINDTIKQ